MKPFKVIYFKDGSRYELYKDIGSTDKYAKTVSVDECGTRNNYHWESFSDAEIDFDRTRLRAQNMGVLTSNVQPNVPIITVLQWVVSSPRGAVAVFYSENEAQEFVTSKYDPENFTIEKTRRTI